MNSLDESRESSENSVVVQEQGDTEEFTTNLQVNAGPSQTVQEVPVTINAANLLEEVAALRSRVVSLEANGTRNSLNATSTPTNSVRANRS